MYIPINLLFIQAFVLSKVEFEKHHTDNQNEKPKFKDKEWSKISLQRPVY